MKVLQTSLVGVHTRNFKRKCLFQQCFDDFLWKQCFKIICNCLPTNLTDHCAFNPKLDTRISFFFFFFFVLLRHAQGTPPEIWNGLDWRALVGSRPPNIGKLRGYHFILFNFFGKKINKIKLKKSEFLRFFGIFGFFDHFWRKKRFLGVSMDFIGLFWIFLDSWDFFGLFFWIFRICWTF